MKFDGHKWISAFSWTNFVFHRQKNQMFNFWPSYILTSFDADKSVYNRQGIKVLVFYKQMIIKLYQKYGFELVFHIINSKKGASE